MQWYLTSCALRCLRLRRSLAVAPRVYRGCRMQNAMCICCAKYATERRFKFVLCRVGPLRSNTPAPGCLGVVSGQGAQTNSGHKHHVGISGLGVQNPDLMFCFCRFHRLHFECVLVLSCEACFVLSCIKRPSSDDQNVKTTAICASTEHRRASDMNSA